MKISPHLQTAAEIKSAIQQLTCAENPVITVGGRMLQSLVDYLEASGATPSVVAELRPEGIWLWRAEPIGGVEALVSVDRPDYGPVRDGLPVMHYRLRIKCDGVPMSREWRTSDLAKVEYLIRQAFDEAPDVAEKE